MQTWPLAGSVACDGGIGSSAREAAEGEAGAAETGPGVEGRQCESEVRARRAPRDSRVESMCMDILCSDGCGGQLREMRFSMPTRPALAGAGALALLAVLRAVERCSALPRELTA